MREWFAMLKPNPWLTKKLLLAAILIGVGVGSFCWGRHHASANATTPPGDNDIQGNGASASNGTRVVAYVNQQPVFREELGEYLIARFGAERLEFLVNRKIVEMECRKHNIVVTDADVEARFKHELEVFGGGVPLSVDNFVNNMLKRFGKTLFEWKEDVIRPKLMMEALVRSTIKITDDDVREGFEARYGPKVECRMIVIDDSQRALVQKIWDEAHVSPEAFIAKAKTQAIPTLANAEGRVPPIHKHFGDKALEDAAFRLKPGEVSGYIQMKDKSWVILLCERHLPANALVRIEDERMKVHREMEELRLAQRIPEVFKQMQKAAAPQFILRNENSPVSVRTEPMPRLAPPPGQAPAQLPPNTPLPAPGIAPPSVTQGK